MPEIKIPVISKEDAGEITKIVKENTLTIIWGVLTAAALIAAVNCYLEYLALLIPMLTAPASVLIVKYQNLKNRVRELRIAVDAMDDALSDNTVTVETIRDIFLKIRKLLLR